MISVDAIARMDIGSVMTGPGYDFISNYARMGSGRAMLYTIAESLNITLNPEDSYNNYLSRFSAVTLCYLFERRTLQTVSELHRRNLNLIKDAMTPTHAAAFALFGISVGDTGDLLHYTLNTLTIDAEQFADIVLESVVKCNIKANGLAMLVRHGTGRQIKLVIDKLYANANREHVKETLEQLAARGDFNELCQQAIPRIARDMGGQNE